MVTGPPMLPWGKLRYRSWPPGTLNASPLAPGSEIVPVAVVAPGLVTWMVSALTPALAWSYQGRYRVWRARRRGPALGLVEGLVVPGAQAGQHRLARAHAHRPPDAALGEAVVAVLARPHAEGQGPGSGQRDRARGGGGPGVGDVDGVGVDAGAGVVVPGEVELGGRGRRRPGPALVEGPVVPGALGGEHRRPRVDVDHHRPADRPVGEGQVGVVPRGHAEGHRQPAQQKASAARRGPRVEDVDRLRDHPRAGLVVPAEVARRHRRTGAAERRVVL